MQTPRTFLRYLLGAILGLALAGGVAVAISVITSITSPSASAAPTCTDTFNNTNANGEWDNAGNWSTGTLPGPSDVVCFAAGVTTVYYDTGNGDTINDIEGGAGVSLDVETGSLTMQDSANTSTLGSITVTYGGIYFDGPTTIASGITLQDGTFGGNGAVTASTLSWTGGNFVGGSGSLTVSGATTISTGEANVTWVLQSYTLTAQSGATFVASGVTDPGFQIQYGGVLNLGNSGSSTPTTSTIAGGYNITAYSTSNINVEPSDTLEDTGASGSTVAIGPTLNDNGTVTLENSGVTFNSYDAYNAATSSGVFNTSAGSTLELAGQNLTNANGSINPSATSPGTDTLEIQNSTISGPITVGTLETDGGNTTTFNGGFDVGQLIVSSSTFDVNGSTPTYTVTGTPSGTPTTAITVDGGNLGGSGIISTPLLDWTSGNLVYNNSGGALDVSGLTTIATSTTNETWALQGYTLNANGGVAFSGAPTNPGFVMQYSAFLNLGGSSTIPGGYFINQYSTSILTLQKGATLQDTGASGSTVTIAPEFNDNGTVSFAHSGVTFDAYDGSGGGNSSGVFDTTAGSTLQLAGQNLTNANGSINPSATSPGTDTLQIQNSTVSGPITVGTLETDGGNPTTFDGGFDVGQLIVSNATFTMNAPATYTVTGAPASSPTTAVTLNGGTISGSGTIVAPLLNWTAGNLSGNNNGGELTVTGTTTIATSTALETAALQGYILNAEAGVTFSGSPVNPGFIIQYSGVLDLGGSSTIPGGYDLEAYSTSTLNLEKGATLQDTGASGSDVLIYPTLNNSGTVSFENSGVNFYVYDQYGTATSSGVYNTSANSTLWLWGQNLTNTNGAINPSATSPGSDTLEIDNSTVAGPFTVGTLEANNNTTTFNGGFDVGQMIVANGTFDMDSTATYTVTGVPASSPTAGVTLDGGVISGNATVVTPLFDWTSGYLSGSNNGGELTVTGATTIATSTANETWSLQGYILNAAGGATFSNSPTDPGFIIEYNGVLDLGGTSTIPGGYDLQAYSTSTINLDKGATLQDTGASGSDVYITPTFNNSGTVSFENSGVTLYVYDTYGTATSSGVYDTTAGSTLWLWGQNLTNTNGSINPSATSPGTDTLEIDNSTVAGPFTAGTLEANGNTTTFNGGFDVGQMVLGNGTFQIQGTSNETYTAGGFTLDGGTLTGNDLLSTTTFDWTSGNFSGSNNGGVVDVSGLTTIATGMSTDEWYLDGYTLNANGGVDFSNTNGSAAVIDPGFGMEYNATLNLGGTSTMPGGYTISDYSTNAINVASGASLSVGGTQGLTEISVPFTTAGSVTIPTGTVAFGSFSQSGGTTELASSSSKLTTGSAVSLTGGTFEGDGEVAADNGLDNSGGTVQPGVGAAAGTLDIVGTYTQGSGGTLVSNLGGATAGTGYGQLEATTADLAGTLDINDQGSFKPTSADTFDLVEAPVGGVSGTFGTVTPTGFTAPDVVTYTATAVVVTFNASVTPVINLTATSASTVYGQAVTFTATVTGGSSTATGTVQFKDGSSNLGSAETLSSGAAQFTTSSLSVGTHSITAVYSGDSNYSAGTSSAYTEKVAQVGTTMSFAPNVNPAGAGQKVSLIAQVTANSPSSAVPSGTVTFYNGSTKLGTASLVNGVATYTTTFKAGSYTLKATYPSSTDFAGESKTASLTVKSTGSTTSIKESATRVLAKVPVTFTATVKTSSGAVVKSGDVEFMNGLKEMKTVAVNSSGVATLSYSFSGAGTESVTATYKGSSTLGGSESSAVKLLVQEQGYRMVGKDGGVFDFGGAAFYGSLPHSGVTTTSVVGITNTPDGLGYWVVLSTGKVYPFGDAKTYSADQSGSASNVIALLSTADGKGYWLVSSSGTVYRYGDAASYGSKSLSGVVGAAATADGKGYWLVTNKGKVYPLGDAKTYSAISGQSAVSGTVTGFAPTTDGKGYYLATSTGKLYEYGDAKSYGSVSGVASGSTIQGIAVDPYGNGIWAAGSNGSIYVLGSAPNDGGVSGSELTAPICGIATFP